MIPQHDHLLDGCIRDLHEFFLLLCSFCCSWRHDAISVWRAHLTTKVRQLATKTTSRVRLAGGRGAIGYSESLPMLKRACQGHRPAERGRRSPPRYPPRTPLNLQHTYETWSMCFVNSLCCLARSGAAHALSASCGACPLHFNESSMNESTPAFKLFRAKASRLFQKPCTSPMKAIRVRELRSSLLFDIFAMEGDADTGATRGTHRGRTPARPAFSQAHMLSSN